MTQGYYRPGGAVWPPRPTRRGPAARRLLVGASVLVLLAACGAAAATALRLHPRVLVRRVVLEGVPEPRRAEVEAVTDPWIGRPLLSVDLDAAVAALSSRPWVERAAARRVVPDTIAVRLAARPAVAVARRGDELWAVDAEGGFLGPLKEEARAEDFVVIDPSGAGDERAGTARGTAFVTRLKADDPDLLGRLSEVVVTRDGIAVIDKIARLRLLFGPEALEPRTGSLRWRALLALLPEIERHGLLRREVDLRFRDRIVLKAPASEGERGKT